MMNRAAWVNRTRELPSRIRSAFKNPGVILFALAILAAIPAFVSFEPAREDRDGARSLSQSTAPFEMPSLAPAGEKLIGKREMAGGEVKWEAHAGLGTADETEADEFDCMIEPWEKISVRSPVIGRIDAIHVERADVVRAGDLLVELDSDLAKAELDVAARRTQMTASIRALEARNLLGARRGARATELFARNAMPLDAKDEILTEKEISGYDLEDAHDQHSLANLQLARERARYEQRRIRSPVTGIVANRMMSVGEVVDEETVLEIAQIDPLRVEVVLPAIEFGRIERGMRAAVIPEIPGDEVVVATVRLVDGIIDSASGTFGAELELPNPNHEIPGGLRCRVQFMGAVAELEEVALAEPIEQ
jgi:RND family efflux transporter MFP subunit